MLASNLIRIKLNVLSKKNGTLTTYLGLIKSLNQATPSTHSLACSIQRSNGNPISISFVINRDSVNTLKAQLAAIHKFDINDTHTMSLYLQGA